MKNKKLKIWLSLTVIGIGFAIIGIQKLRRNSLIKKLNEKKEKQAKAEAEQGAGSVTDTISNTLFGNALAPIKNSAFNTDFFRGDKKLLSSVNSFYAGQLVKADNFSKALASNLNKFNVDEDSIYNYIKGLGAKSQVSLLAWYYLKNNKVKLEDDLKKMGASDVQDAFKLIQGLPDYLR